VVFELTGEHRLLEAGERTRLHDLGGQRAGEGDEHERP
jgi:hypothetical protein